MAQRMLIYQNAVFLPWQYDHVVMLSKNQSAHSSGSHLHLINLNILQIAVN